MGDLCERMCADLKIGGYSPTTTKVFLQFVQQFARFHARSPVDLGEEEIRAFLVHLAARPVRRYTLRLVRAAMCFLFEVTLGRAAEVAFLRQEQAMSTEGASHG